jgi:hypothetical protein
MADEWEDSSKKWIGDARYRKRIKGGMGKGK